MWLRFRGVSGTIQVIEEGVSEKPVCEGFIRLTLNQVQLDGNLSVYPFVSEFAYSKTKDSEPLATFLLDRNQNKRETNGEKIEGLEPDFLTQILVSPLEQFAALPNEILQGVLTSLWTITKVSPQTFVFKPNETVTSEGFSAPEMEFEQGHLAKFVSKKMEGQPFTTTIFESPVESNGFSYPSRLRFILDPNGNSACQEFKLTVILSDIDVVVE